jgi:hypothetical protein
VNVKEKGPLPPFWKFAQDRLKEITFAALREMTSAQPLPPFGSWQKRNGL